LDPEAYCREAIELLRSGPADRFTGAEPTEILFLLSALIGRTSSAEEFTERLTLLAGEVRPDPRAAIARAAGAILRDWEAVTAEAAQACAAAADP
jgi:hypothetical protein